MRITTDTFEHHVKPRKTIVPASLLLRVAVVLLALAPGLGFAQVKLRVGDVSTIAPDWPNFVARDKGFYAKEGIDPDVTFVGNVAGTVQQVAGGNFDIGVSTFDLAIRAIESGADIVMIGGLCIKYPLEVMAGKNIHSARDMVGKTIVLPFSRDLLTITWNRWVKEQGIDPRTIDQVYEGATPNRYTALATGAVQAAILSQPFDIRAKNEGYNMLLDVGTYAKDFGFLVLIGRPQWLKANGDTARAYLRAMSSAVDWIYDPVNRREAIEILARNTKLPQDVAEQTYDYYLALKPFSPKMAIPAAIVEATRQTLIELGDIKPGSTKRLTDTSYAP